jgi:hypothetical protein
MKKWWMTQKMRGIRGSALLLVALALLLAAPVFRAQGLDICGCAATPNLQPFDSANSATWPTGSFLSGNTIVIKVPADGVMKFSSFTLANRHLTFSGNTANTPVTILVAGNVSIANSGCCFNMDVNGGSGSGGNASFAGVGGSSGPGGFRGGDGANQAINGAAIGGAGFGPGGGAGGATTGFQGAQGGVFLGLPELIPLLGGSGGGGGSSTVAGNTNCSGGGGGGGGGALLIAANGTLTIQDYQLFADGGGGAGQGDGNCSSPGGGGSGGAIRLVANKLVQGGTANIFARGVNNGATNGRIRLESVDASSQTNFNTTPAALRITGPTPLANPINPTVTITSVGGSPVPAVPQGTFGAIDIVLPAPGATSVAVATTGVPSGTTVAVTVKPRIGAQPTTQTVPLTNCNQAGACTVLTTFNLNAGAHVVEARATFQVP